MLACSGFNLPLDGSVSVGTSTQFGAAMVTFMLYGSILVTAVGTIAFGAFALLYRLWRSRVLRDFNQKCVFITGTDKGFGRNLALELDRRGLTVYAGCHSEPGAENLRNQASRRLKAIVIEVTSRESVEKARKFIENDLPPGKGLWALVNNAGIARGMMFDFARVEDYREVLEVNFFGVLGVTEVFLPLIKKSRGRIINVVSIMGRCTLAAGPYSSSKFAMEAYSDGLRRAMKAFGVHVAIIEPGFFHTNMTDPSFWENEIERLWKKLPLNLQEDYGTDFKEKSKSVLGKFIAGPPLSSFNTLKMVTDDIVHALGAKHPKSRYVNGVDAQLLYKPVSFLPDWILDFFMCTILPYYKVSQHNNNKVRTSGYIHLTSYRSKMNRFFEEKEHAEIYQQYRPKIPPGVVVNILKYLEEKCPAPHPLAVDVGCGSGQTTLHLAPYFNKVIGTDISEAQIAQAQRVADIPGNVSYIVSPSESLPLEPGSVDVLLGTMCFHWFDLPVFYKEVNRVLQPNGVVCAIGNSPAAIVVPNNPELTERLHAITIEQGFRLLGPYFQPEVYTVLKRYADLDFPFADCVRESAFVSDTQMTVKHYVNNVRSFSAYRAFLLDKPEEAKAMVCDYEKRIMELLGAKGTADEEIVTVRNEFFYVMGRKQCVA